jgi:acetoin utilization deacetylase AcuC-like enzyme
MPQFAAYLHPHTCYLSKPIDSIKFSGYSYPYFAQVRQALVHSLNPYPQLSIRKAYYHDYVTVHDPKYLKKITLKALNKPLDQVSLELPKCSIECEGLEYCIPAYLYGLGGMLEAIDQMKKGNIERAYCFSLVGHHAYSNWGHGYCLLNPLSASAIYAQKQGFERILILDWDIHHGDGTQSIFANNSHIYCISIHSGIDLYMAKASDLKLGTTTVGKQLGHCNIPLVTPTFPIEILAEEGITGDFYTAKEGLKMLKYTLENLPFQPDLILIFSGYDSHQDDCGKDLTNWTEQEFILLTKWVIQLAKTYGCPILSTHGGGYNFKTTIKTAISHINILAKFN